MFSLYESASGLPGSNLIDESLGTAVVSFMAGSYFPKGPGAAFAAACSAGAVLHPASSAVKVNNRKQLLAFWFILHTSLSFNLIITSLLLRRNCSFITFATFYYHSGCRYRPVVI
jgi:hypothetical protein